MRIAVYTSCAANYLAKALALADSLSRNAPGATLTLCLCDRWPAAVDQEMSHAFKAIWSPTDLGFNNAWIFQHNVMELCTAVKGRALLRLMKESSDADLYLYLDPDVYVYNDLSAIVEYIGDACIGLVPHILLPEESDIGVRLTEMSVTEHGIYNLGHLVIRKGVAADRFAAWWADRLDKYCFDDKEAGLFTDQRWVDLAPAIFDDVRILRVPNLDVASWNLFGRVIRQKKAGNERSFTVNGWPLLTYHFSGTGPTGTHRRVREIFDPGNGATAEIERLYEAAIHKYGQATLARIAPAWDSFDNGKLIPAEARKLYRRHPDLQSAFPDPYATGNDSYFAWLIQHRPALMSAIRLSPARARQAFQELFDEQYYLATYPDAAQSISAGKFSNPVEHYVRLGSRLNYDPNEFFVSVYYRERAKHHDSYLLENGRYGVERTLLWHYIVVGLANGIEPIEFFDSNWYLREYADLEAAFRVGQLTLPLAHYLNFGAHENRNPGPSFNATRYLSDVPEARRLVETRRVRGAFGALVRLGNVEGRLSVPGDT